MSRYVEKPYGMVLSSGNEFFFRDEQDVYRGFPCSVWLRRVTFSQINVINCVVRSPAEQILFYPVKFSPGEFEKSYGGDTYYRLTDWWCGWLDNNCPGWGYPPAKNADRVPSIFFARRKDGLAFVNKVCELLKGMEFS